MGRPRKVAVPKVRRRRRECVDEFVKNAICRIVHDFFFRNEFPTINNVLKVVNDDENLPQFKRAAFYELLKNMNFKFIYRIPNNMVIEKEKIVLWRRQYLRSIKKYREEGRKIYYLGETQIRPVRDLTKTTEEGIIICHIGNDDGFVKEGLWVFKFSTSQMFTEGMSSVIFEHWFVNVLQYIEDNSVIVMDNAQCHSRKVEQIPTSATKRADIEKWLTEKQIPFDSNLLKVELLDIVHTHKPKYNKYVCDELAQQHNKVVLRLPPYHSELNPMETISIQLKSEVTACNMTLKLCDICEVINSITRDKLRECINYVHTTVEPWMWKLDNLMELQIDITECFVTP